MFRWNDLVAFLSQRTARVLAFSVLVLAVATIALRAWSGR